jgi:hypothetical protein
MKQAIINIVVIVGLMGCSAANQLGDDYLNADDIQTGGFGAAMQELKYDYLNAREPVIKESRKAEIYNIAKQALLSSVVKDDYSEIDYEIDESPRMPETFAYYFVHFLPNRDKPKITNTTYLVVIDRLNNRVAYQNVYIHPKGDSFYKYYDVLKIIRGK